jgi:hypothetical protein
MLIKDGIWQAYQRLPQRVEPRTIQYYAYLTKLHKLATRQYHRCRVPWRLSA